MLSNSASICSTSMEKIDHAFQLILPPPPPPFEEISNIYEVVITSITRKQQLVKRSRPFIQAGTPGIDRLNTRYITTS